MGINDGFHGLRQLLILLAFTAVLSTILVAGPAQAECGFLDASTIQPGQVVTSCNGAFALTYQDDNNVVLKHIASGVVTWSQPASQGSAYAFYRPGNPDLGIAEALPPTSEYPALTASAAVPSTDDDSNRDTNVALASASDSSDLDSTTATSSDSSNTDADSAGDSSAADSTIALLPSEPVLDTDTTVSTPDSSLGTDTASVDTVASSGQDTNVAARSPTSPSESYFESNAVAFSSASNVFLDPPSNSYSKKRIKIKKRKLIVDENGLHLTDDGNMNVMDKGNENKVIWSSDSAGIYCGQNLFIAYKGRDAVIAKVEQQEKDSDMSKLLRNSPCSISNVYVTQAGGHSQEIRGDNPGSGSDSGPQRRFVLPGHTVQNRFTFYLSTNFRDPKQAIQVTIGQARLTKTFYYDGYNVSSTEEGAYPDRPKVTGEATLTAQVVGFFFGYINPGSDVEQYVNWNDSPHGAHMSSRVTRMNFELLPFLPFGPIFMVFKLAFHHELWIKAFGDGHVECRGGQHCSRLAMSQVL